MPTAYYDDSTGIVHTVASRLATIKEFDAYMPQVTELLARSQARHGCALHLVEASDNPIQEKSAFAHMSDATKAQAHLSVRCAVVLSSALARMQIRRMPQSAEREFFGSVAEATTWLLGPQHRAALA
ncbi:hypothetical protein [Sphingomonas immobilis]|uniref:hypothetical protein n=1 Tax=Sphingomonas immobilis TaxID=3063997 RepID=UPI00272D35DA|nr:hypothetical protein [Sphingomonas sp. CA1-15]